MTHSPETPGLAMTPSSEHVASLLPPTAPVPEPARRVNFFKALLVHWLMPRRYGPHLAAGSWRRALAAHLVSMLALGAALVPVLFESLRIPAWNLLALREFAAQAVLAMAVASAGSRTEWAEALLIVLALPLLELGLILLAVLIMPWYAGGDRAGSVLKRSLKSVYWSTTLLIPAAAVVVGITQVEIDPGRWLERHDDLLTAAILIAVLAAPAVLLGRLLLAGGTRYVGPADGPAFAPREPHCDQCGYLLIGLPVEARCPECGLSVQGSLPGGRRHSTAWQRNEFRPRGFADLLGLQGRVLRGTQAWQTLPVQEGLSAARHFWWMTWCLMVLVPLLLVALCPDPPFEREALALGITVGLTSLIVPLVLQALMMCLACLWGQLRAGIADYRCSAIVCYYASPLLWPMILLFFACLEYLHNSDLQDLLSDPAAVVLGVTLRRDQAVCLTAGLAAVGMLVFWWLRLTRAIWQVRFANV